MQWVVSAYTVTFAAFILSAGAAGDRLGARRLFAGGFVLFTAASAACAAAPTAGVLIAARAVQGVGAAVLVALFGALIAGSSLVSGAGLALVVSVIALVGAGIAAIRLPA